jgi:hypothetical protein
MSTMSTPTVLPWHKEAAQKISAHHWKTGTMTVPEYAAIIAAHDPHEETVRLLEEACEAIHEIDDAFGEPLLDNISLRKAIRAHLTVIKG